LVRVGVAAYASTASLPAIVPPAWFVNWALAAARNATPHW